MKDLCIIRVLQLITCMVFSREDTFEDEGILYVYAKVFRSHYGRRLDQVFHVYIKPVICNVIHSFNCQAIIRNNIMHRLDFQAGLHDYHLEFSNGIFVVVGDQPFYLAKVPVPLYMPREFNLWLEDVTYSLLNDPFHVQPIEGRVSYSISVSIEYLGKDHLISIRCLGGDFLLSEFNWMVKHSFCLLCFNGNRGFSSFEAHGLIATYVGWRRIVAVDTPFPIFPQEVENSLLCEEFLFRSASPQMSLLPVSSRQQNTTNLFNALFY